MLWPRRRRWTCSHARWTLVVGWIAAHCHDSRASHCRRVARQSRARAGGSASAGRSVLRTDCPAVLGLVAASHNSLRSLRSLRSDRVRQVRSTKRACARGPPDLCSSPPRRRRPCPVRAFREVQLRWCGIATPLRGWPSRQAVPGRGDLWGGRGAQALAELGARSALRRSDSAAPCLSAANAANVASCAARPQAEHRRAVGAQRRPLHHEPLPGAACRDALNVPKEFSSQQPLCRQAASAITAHLTNRTQRQARRSH